LDSTVGNSHRKKKIEEFNIILNTRRVHSVHVAIPNRKSCIHAHSEPQQELEEKLHSCQQADFTELEK